MRRRLVILLGFALVLFALAPAVMADHANGNAPHNFRAHLSGSEEVDPVDTNAQGQAIFQLSKDGTELDYKLIVANIDDVVAAHIHCGAEGANGPVGVTLFSGGPISNSGVLVEATVTETDAPPPGEDENACGWETLDDVIAAIESGDTYVNVHTLANPGGEIRGQIR